MTDGLLPFAEAGKRLGKKSAKTVRRWIEKITGFPQPVQVGGSRYLLESELEAFIEKLKEERGKRQKNK